MSHECNCYKLSLLPSCMMHQPHVAASSPFILTQPLHISFPFDVRSACPAIGHGVRGCLNTKAVWVRGRCYGLTFHRPLSRFVCRTLSSLPLMKWRQVKNRERGGLFHLSAGPGDVFMKVFRLVREELRWGSVWQAGCAAGVLP